MISLAARKGCAVAIAAFGGFVGGALFVGLVVWFSRSPIVESPVAVIQPSPPQTPDDGGAGIVEGVPARRNGLPAPDIPRIGPDPIEELRRRKLELPVAAARSEDLHSSFSEARGSRLHEAIDVLAPRNTPVIAVEDGSVARLFVSRAGGNTIYQFDPSETYCYYYAHLERYADGLRERQRLRRGQVIGYVGSSGNAPPDTPHLHFAIFKLTDQKRWWEGTPIDPFLVLK